MARKHLLTDLLSTKLSADNSEANDTHSLEHASSAFSQKGAIGAVSRSIERLKSQSIADLDPDLIDEPIVSDRLQETDHSFAEFATQIKEHGQQVPILVRPHPEREGRYQIAYGRRRLRAVKLAGKQVKATIRPLTDEELVIAQGQENNARQDLSYIEKALYAFQLEAKGFSREIIMASLAIDKAALSHLISTAERIPDDIIRQIGSAPKAGRDRWVKVATLINDASNVQAVRQLLKKLRTLSSDDKFIRVLSSLKPISVKKETAAKAWAPDGKSVSVTSKSKPKGISVDFTDVRGKTFGAWIINNLDDLFGLYEAYEQSEIKKTGD